MIEKGQGIRKKLDDRQTANMVKFAAQGPDVRFRKITDQVFILKIFTYIFPSILLYEI